MIRILLAEDQAMVRQGLKMMIESDDELRVTSEAANGKEAVELNERHLFDLVILDIQMPVMNGLEAGRLIRKRWPERKVLILTTFNDDEYALEALKGGASGYLLKDAEPDALIRSIRSCLSGGLSLQDDVAAKVIPRLLHGNEEAEKTVDSSITPRELDILKLVGEGRSNREISEELGLSVGTVKNHMSQMMEKLDLRDRTQMAIYAIRHNVV
ncbi:LuxR family two component transcriptional regulator [Fontibacillus phaseoli]|uniref:LuxR family two component transcriptional regulator n=1 Tax=Fontibacillus phaseoli TaxID=1416533 RepID=A0A369BQX6_9BACL|nr:response regulator transcription factor [Fontibacillus phaseoli]RCX23455.1 LuxR family two component transcriptional regulator [Fontibacillus phaseoli]